MLTINNFAKKQLVQYSDRVAFCYLLCQLFYRNFTCMILLSLCFSQFTLGRVKITNFDTGCVEVTYTTSLQLAAKCFLTSAQLGQKLDFWLPTNLVGGRFLFPTSCREVDFRNSVQLGQNYFFANFSWNASKNAFLVGYHWERFFRDHSPNGQACRLPLENDYGQKAFLTGYHVRAFSKTFPNPLINRF